MGKKVYLLCPVCSGLTDGIGCGDSPNDLISCKKCNNSFSARKIGRLYPHTGKDVIELPLYVKKESSEMLIEGE